MSSVTPLPRPILPQGVAVAVAAAPQSWAGRGEVGDRAGFLVSHREVLMDLFYTVR